MSQKLFKITLVLFLAVVSVAFAGFLLTGLISMLANADLISISPAGTSGSSGISAVAGGVSENILRLVYLLAVLVLLVYFWRRRKSR